MVPVVEGTLDFSTLADQNPKESRARMNDRGFEPAALANLSNALVH